VGWGMVSIILGQLQAAVKTLGETTNHALDSLDLRLGKVETVLMSKTSSR
jgi:hypothetical protein